MFYGENWSELENVAQVARAQEIKGSIDLTRTKLGWIKKIQEEGAEWGSLESLIE